MKQHIALFSLKHLPNVSTYDPEQEQLNNDIFMIFYFTFRALKIHFVYASVLSVKSYFRFLFRFISTISPFFAFTCTREICFCPHVVS